METKELKIQAPEGYTIDYDNSSFDCIKFKPIKKDLTYDDIAKELFKQGGFFFTSSGSYLSLDMTDVTKESNNCTSKGQAEKLLAINKLMNVAKYLNDGWKPNWLNDDEYKYSIYYWVVKDLLTIDHNTTNCHCTIYFKEAEFAKEAIKILGEETVKLAVSTDW